MFSWTGCDKDNPASPDETSYVETLMTLNDVPGVSIAIIRNFQIYTLEVYGVKNVTSEDPVTFQTLFQAASISKPVSSMAALKPVQDGKLRLDENINLSLTSWQVTENTHTSDEKVTLRLLMSHTAGTTVHGFRGYRYGENRPTLIQVLNGSPPANSPAIVVDTVPGTISRYSGGGFCIMQQAMIDVEQADFPQILQEAVLTPLSMDNSTFDQPLGEARLNQAATGHLSNGQIIPGDHHVYPEMAAAGLWTTPANLANFLIEVQLSLAEQSNRLLTAETTDLMLTPVLNSGYGLGMSIMNINGEIYFGHGGANEGFRCFMMAHKTDGVGVVVMTNSDNGSDLIDTLLYFIGENEGWAGY